MDVDVESSPEYEDAAEQKSLESKKNGPKKKKKKTVAEPQKPASAYALFFRDTQAAIKAENSMATFGEISKIVASMWDSLSEEAKQVYKQKTENAKRDYLKQLAGYRAYCAAQDDDDDSTPLMYLKGKSNDKGGDSSIASVKTIPPPPTLQKAPIVITKGICIQQTLRSKNDSVSSNTSSPGGSQSSGDLTIIKSDATVPSDVEGKSNDVQIQFNTLNSIGPAPIQLRNIVPKAQGPITILQSKPGQVIKLIPANQASSIAGGGDGKPRIIKMTEFIRGGLENGSKQVKNEVQPILQTLAQETETLHEVEENGNGNTNGIDIKSGEVIPIDEADFESDQATPMSVDGEGFDKMSNYRTPNVRVCVRDGCPNLATSDPQWNDEYCSSSCVVEHCRDVFDAWVSNRQIRATAV